MPPKSKVKKLLESKLEKARKVKKRDISGGDDQPASLEDLAAMSDEALDTMDEDIDPSFDLDSSIKSDSSHLMETFCDEFVTHLELEDRVGLGLFLYFQLITMLNKGETDAAEISGMMVGKSDKTIREWRNHFFENDGEVPTSKQGHYQRSGVLWNSESLNKKARRYISCNAHVKGRSNLTSGLFCQWVNDELLPNETLEPGFPRKISAETGRKWMHELGFEVKHVKKCTFVDGHEREDVVEYRNIFLRRMITLGFLHPRNAPTEEAKEVLQRMDLECSRPDLLDKTVIFFHDESTFQANDDQKTFWGTKDTYVIRPKSRGSGIMVSDFIDEYNGYLGLTADEYENAKKDDPTIRMQARSLLEYGEAREGYWTSDKFMEQLEKAVKIAEVKYPKQDGWRLVWIFDHSSCHAAMADDALDVSQMNVKPGGKQRVMRDGWWGGKPQAMNFHDGVPKGLRVVLQERGINTGVIKGDDLRIILANHPDFKYEKSRVERFLSDKGHIVYLLPKYHCELNPIERVWAQAKRYTRAYCKYTFPSLRNNILPAMESVSLESIKKHFIKIRHYMYAYLEEVPAGSELEKRVKKYKAIIKSHRRISEHQ